MSTPPSGRPPNFEEIIRYFCSEGVEFVIIGGLAASLHGSSYITVDTDLCYNRSTQNLDRIARALTAIHATLRGAPADLPFRLDAKTIKAGLNFTFSTDLGDIDIFGEVSGIGSYSDVLSETEEIMLFGFRVHVLGLDGLIRAKRAASRRKDLMIMPELEALRELQRKKKDEKK
jgi:predicted nucleotidyltransferase